MTQRILFFGMEGIFSRAPLIELINAHHHVCAIIVPRPDQFQPAHEPIRRIPPPSPLNKGGWGDPALRVVNDTRAPNIIGIAWNAGIEVFEVSTLRDERIHATIHQLNPDLIVVACFPHLIPQLLITNYPALNLHPSVLPNYRGPAPLFWIFHDGLEHAGVTIHLMDARADTGDIVVQERVALPDGISYDDADKILSAHAARLLTQVLGEAPTGAFRRTPQAQTAAPGAPNPSERDYTVTPAWSARRAFNFVRGEGDKALLVIGNSRFAIQEAISFQENFVMEKDMEQVGEYWQVRFADGILICRLSTDDYRLP